MNLQPVYSVELHLPEGKLPGYYAQIVKGIADAAELIDRDKTLLFVADEAAATAVEAFVERYKVATERGQWLTLDDKWSIEERRFTDFGVITRSGGHFLDLQLAAVMALSPGSGDELAQALEQAEEHAVARANEDGRQLLAVDRHLIELVEGIARAYRCEAQLLL